MVGREINREAALFRRHVFGKMKERRYAESMETIEQLLLMRIFPGLFFLAELLGILSIAAILAYGLKYLFSWDLDISFVAILVFGYLLFWLLKERAITREIKNLLIGEAANIALAIPTLARKPKLQTA